jgi:hypothetical protein
MRTQEKIRAIEDAIERSINHQSKMDDVAWSVPALSSLKIRHLMNNLGAISTRYLECGVHRAGLFSSTIRNNDNLQMAVGIDSFASDEENEEKIEPIFHENVRKCIPHKPYLFFKGDTFSIDPRQFYSDWPIDLYLYDADHSYKSQRKAVTHFLPAMADEFIMCVDDFDWEEVSRGTREGLLEAPVQILYERVFKGNNHDNETWWNGFAIFLLKKK